MTDQSIEELALELRMLMITLSKVFRQTLKQQLQEQDVAISMLQFNTLHILSHEGDQTISELSRTFMLDPSTLVPSIDGLEKKGLVVRERDPNDRRRNPLCLTDDGKELLHRITMNRDDDFIHNSLQLMGQESAEELLRLLRELIDNTPDGDAILTSTQCRIEPYLARIKDEHASNKTNG